MARVLFFLGVLFSLSPFASPPLALAAGLLFGLTLVHPYAKESRTFSKFLLQGSVVALGFGMNLNDVLRAGRSGFVYTALGITFALAIGMAIGKMLRVDPRPAFLISTGTAICGGSAIAAVAPITGADENEMSVSLGTVFILNSVALLIFPAIGHSFNLTQQQFGLWAALAIHDTSSVVGATAKYSAGITAGATALAIGTTVKLARALWIIPVTLGTAAVRRSAQNRAVSNAAANRTSGLNADLTASPSKAKIQIPWFVLLFVLAAVANTYMAVAAPAFKLASQGGRVGLTLTLFLIGAGLSRKQLAKVGVRPLVQGVLLWLIVGLSSLALIRAGIIGL